MSHLAFGDCVWCDGEEEADIDDAVNDPRKATCVECLQRAASYGAAAAMRCAAVEAAKQSTNNDITRERDEAMRRLNAMQAALERQATAFFCHSCLRLYKMSECVLTAGGLSWCAKCAPNKVPT